MIQWVLRAAVGAQARQALRRDRPAQRRRARDEGGLAPQHRLGLADLLAALSAVAISAGQRVTVLRFACAQRVEPGDTAKQRPNSVYELRALVYQVPRAALALIAAT